MSDEKLQLNTGYHDETSLKYMLRLAGPMVITTISFTIMQFVDRLMVSRLGTDALAAILPAGYVSFIPGGFAVGAMASLNTFVSQSLGRGRTRECSNYFWQATYMGVAYFVGVVLVMWPMAPWIFKLMGQPEEVARMEVIYLRIMLYAHILAVLNWSSTQFFMGIHRPVVTMCASIIGQVANVIGNYVLIFGKFGLPALGIAGAGWGTFIGIAVAASVNLMFFLSPGINREYKSRTSLHLDPGKILDLIKVGLPAGISLTVNVAFWGVILTSLVGDFGKPALAATSAVLSYTNLSVMPIVGFGTALTAAVGKSIGRDRKDLAARQTGVCLRIGFAYMGFVGLCFILFRGPLIRFWSDEPAVIEAGEKILVCAAFYQLFHAMRTIFSGALRGAGDTVWLALISGAGALLVLGVGGRIMVAAFPSLGYMGPWIAAGASIATVGLANWRRFKSNRWMKIDLFKRRAAEGPAEIETVVE